MWGRRTDGEPKRQVFGVYTTNFPRAARCTDFWDVAFGILYIVCGIWDIVFGILEIVFDRERILVNTTNFPWPLVVLMLWRSPVSQAKSPNLWRLQHGPLKIPKLVGPARSSWEASQNHWNIFKNCFGAKNTAFTEHSIAPGSALRCYKRHITEVLLYACFVRTGQNTY